MSLDAQVGDLEAVVGRLGLDRFRLFAAASAGPVAIAYAARYPRQISHLVLWCAFARGADIGSRRVQAWRALIDQNRELMTDTCVQLALGWTDSGVGRRAAEQLRDSVTADVALAALATDDAIDVTALLPQIETNTLVLHRREITWLPVDIGRSLASRIVNARLVLLDGESTAPYLGDIESATDAIDRFLETEEPTIQPRRTMDEKQPGSPVRETGHGLTDREVQVLKRVATGRTSKEVAAELVFSVRTIKRHVENIYRKIVRRNRADATAYALTRGLV